MNLRRAATTAFLLFGLATVLAESAALVTFWQRGVLSREKLIQLLTVAYDVDVATMWQDMSKHVSPRDEEQPSYQSVLEERALRSADLDLREMAADKGSLDIRQLADELEQERTQYALLKASFDQQYEDFQRGAVDSSLEEIQRQLESIPSRLAKDQILRILDDRSISAEKSMYFVVAIFKSMPLDRRKRILAEFDSHEMDRLHEILREVRLGAPEITLIRETRERLDEFQREPSPQSTATRPADWN
jgi:hypothetical protein